MKIAFDEHIPVGLVRVFEALVTERKMRRLIGANGRGSANGYEIYKSRDFNALPGDDDYIKKSDVPWIERFAKIGGSIIISGNVDMMAVPQEVLAIQNNDMIRFYFESKWNSWDFFKKSFLLLWHWEIVIQTIQNASAKDVYRIPASFSAVTKLNLISRSGQLELLTDALHTAKKEMRRIRKKLSPKSKGPDGQGKLGIDALVE